MAEPALMPTYSRLPVAFVSGQGSWLTDTQGKTYLDALSGIAVCGLGHAHPAVTRTLSEQAARLMHTSNLYRIPAQEQAGATLIRLAEMDKVFFCNSGAEANEGAIKLARLHGHKKGIERPQILVMEHAFHGRTLATLTATGNRKVQAGFEPLVSGFLRCAYNDLEAARQIISSNQDLAAVMLEPVQGEGGVRPATAEFLQGLRELCNEHQLLLILDEVQTGNGRTGQYFSYQHHAWRPDVVTTAKGLGNGFPVGAVMARGQAAELFQPGYHGSTFGGNPLACSVVQAVLETLEQEHLCARAASLGQYLLQKLQAALEAVPQVLDIRGQGLLLGIELDRPCTELVGAALAEGLLINVTAGSVIRILPPLTLTDEEADELLTRLLKVIRNWLAHTSSQT